MRALARSIPLFALAIAVALAIVLGLRATAHADASTPPFVVIVHPHNPYTSLDRAFVADLFLKKATRWPNGDLVKPADLPPDSAARERFSSDVIKRSVRAVRNYWQQMIFAGRDIPPPELASEEEVVKYVLARPNAVGYVSGTAKLDGARTVTLR
jgi:ABC-type phosphate transport system substrate-binding protein